MKPKPKPKPKMAKAPSRRTSDSQADGEAALYERIRSLVLAARHTVARGVDLVQVHTSFEIGRHIVLHEQRGQARAAYGYTVLQQLAEKLSAEFGRGFSKSNLEYMRRFFVAYQDRSPIAQPDTGESASQGRERPITQFQTGQLVSSANPENTTAIAGNAFGELPRLFALSWTHYVFLLSIKNPDERSFYEIEAAEQGWTLRELKRQCDSALYERLALKLAHQDLGQMQMYVNYFDRDVRSDGENATVGIVLCKRKNEAMVEITLPQDANIHAREYQLFLPSKEELQAKLAGWAA